MAKKKNVWEAVEEALRAVFPYPYPETNWKGEPIKDDELEDYYDPSDDPLIPFLTGQKIKAAQQLGIAAQGIEFVEFQGSFWENVGYDQTPQGTEDECEAIIKIADKHYKVLLMYRSTGGYYLDQEAYEVVPKTVEVVIYE